ncbi:FAD binding domain-containing protein [Trichoderma sp. SZMC 28012]
MPTYSTVSKVDVLIIGAGPAGLMCALWMARLGVNARVVEKRATPVAAGQADGIQSRTFEILDSFGLDQIWRESTHVKEATFWDPDENGKIHRSSRVPNNMKGLSRFDCTGTIHQGVIESFLIQAIRASASIPSHPEVRIEGNIAPSSLHIDETLIDDQDAYPVMVTLKHFDEASEVDAKSRGNIDESLHKTSFGDDDSKPTYLQSAQPGLEELVLAKYLVGCDGAHSWVRKALGQEFRLRGETTEAIWGAMDIIPVTDFPDIRVRSMVRSTSGGSLMMIPRENKLVRLYIQITDGLSTNGLLTRSMVTPEMLIETAQRILSPYTIDFTYIHWWSAYQIGQRSGDHFDKQGRIFLAGDAVHTHSPKAGQGMNVSMQDTYNLGWKIGLACKGLVRPTAIIPTYDMERKLVAKELIAFDRKFSELLSMHSAKDISETSVELKRFFKKAPLFTTGIGVNYPSSILTVVDDEAHGLAKYTVPGKRFASCQVTNHSDGRVWELHHRMPSDGRFRIMVFGGNIADAEQQFAVNALGQWLGKTLIPRYPPINICPIVDRRLQTVRFQSELKTPIIEIFLVHTAPRSQIDVLRDVDSTYHPWHPKLGWDYEYIFTASRVTTEDNIQLTQSPYRDYGIDEERGAVVLVRPDGYVGMVTSVAAKEARTKICNWFDDLLQRLNN